MTGSVSPRSCAGSVTFHTRYPLSLQTYGMQHCVLYYDSLSLSLSLCISISFYIYLYFYLRLHHHAGAHPKTLRLLGVPPRCCRVGRAGHRQNSLDAGAAALGRAAAADAAGVNGGASQGGIGAAGAARPKKHGCFLVLRWVHHGIFGSYGAVETATMSVRFHKDLTAIHSQGGDPVFFDPVCELSLPNTL